MSFSSYYLKSSAVTAMQIDDVEVIGAGGATIESPDLKTANQGSYEITTQAGVVSTITAAQLAANYSPLSGSSLYIPKANIVLADKAAAIEVVVGGGSTVNWTSAPQIGQWFIEGAQTFVDNATFTANYAAFA